MEKSPTVQLSFQLRTSPNVRSVHLLGSWDNYKRQLPLSIVKDASAKPGSWKGTFRFQGSQALKLGGRYWYYYIVDGYHVSHDPAKEFVTEKTTGRKLNVLNVPDVSSKTSKPLSKPGHSSYTQNRPPPLSREVVQGLSLSPDAILSPRPQKPYASRQIREADYEVSPMEALEHRFAASRISDRSRSHVSSSPSELSDSSSGPEFSDLGSNSSGSGRDRSRSPECRCGRYGVTRDGRRVKLDCGGGRCGYGDNSSSSECTSSSDSESENEADRARGGPPLVRKRVQTVMKPTPRSDHSNTRTVPVMLERRPR